MRDYRAYGLRVRSAIPLPFDPLPEPDAFEPDVTVRLGAVPAGLPDGPGNITHTAVWQARPSAFLLDFGEVARYLVTGGREVLIEPLGGNEDDVAAFFTSSAFTVLLQQRGVVTLHAAAVAAKAGAVLLLGRSGVGKSSLAVALVERGHPLLADDVTGVVLGAGGRAMALPGFARQRLWVHTLNEMRWRERAQSRVRQGMEKYWMPAQRACTEPLPVRAALVLTANDRSDVGIEPAPTGSAFWLLWENTHRRRAMDAMGQRPAHFRAVTALAQSVPVARVTRPRHPFLLDELADRVAIHLHDADAGRTGLAGGADPIGCAIPASRAGTAGAGAGRRTQGNGDAEMSAQSAPGIVWIAAWPKSGTTWLRAVLTSYLREDGGAVSINALIGQSANHREAFNEYLGLDSSDMTDEEVARYLPRFREVLAERLCANRPSLEWGRRRNDPVFVKTHEAYRAPGGTPRFPQAGSAGVVYLLRNPLDVAVSYAHHLNWPIDRTIEQAAFHRLQAQEAESRYSEKQPTAPSFFRAGVAGSWRTALTTAQVRALTGAHREVMARFGYLRGDSPASRSRGGRTPSPSSATRRHSSSRKAGGRRR